MKLMIKALTGAAMLTCAITAFAQRGETVRIAWIDPLSGLMAPVGTNQLRSFQFFADQLSGANNPAGVNFEVIGFDNKLSPAESLTALQAAIDRGVRYIAQGNGSQVAFALVDAINRHNSRNPGNEVVFLNYAAVDPDLTNSRCSFWHFRFDADTSMKMEALTDFMKDDPSIRRVFLLNQNYSHGHQVAKFAKENLARKRPDIEIVGEDLHPLAQVRDFAPYIAKIRASGADSVITGNWGSDLSLLVRAANDAGFTGRFFTFYTGVTGTPTALGTTAEGRVYQVAYSHYNMGGQMDRWMADFRQRFNDDFYTGAVVNVFRALSQAMANAQSTDPVRVAQAMSGLRFQGFHGQVEFRRDDHQLQQPLFITRWQRVNSQFSYSPENTGMTLAPVREVSAAAASTPTTCNMQRPR